MQEDEIIRTLHEELTLVSQGLQRCQELADKLDDRSEPEVDITSRHGIQAEIDLMTRVMQAIPRNTRRHIRSIFCDSKATSNYTVELRESGKRAKLDYFLATELASLFVRFAQGYNFLDVNGVQFTADWRFGDEE